MQRPKKVQQKKKGVWETIWTASKVKGERKTMSLYLDKFVFADPYRLNFQGWEDDTSRDAAGPLPVEGKTYKSSRRPRPLPIVLLSTRVSSDRLGGMPRPSALGPGFESRLALCCFRQFRRLGFRRPSTTAARRELSPSISGM